MIKKTFLLIITVILTVNLAGCITINTDSSETPSDTVTPGQKPEAVIDSISPPEIEHGNSVTFNGHASIESGSITDYEWKSNLDGILSSMPAFSTNTLAVGTHAISFRARSDSDLWSEAATGTVVVNPKADPPRINFFKSSPEGILTGSSSVLSWEVENATEVTIDNGIGQVEPSGFKTVFPSLSTEYTLTAVNDSGSNTAQARVDVQQANYQYNNPEIAYFTASYQGAGKWQLRWNVNNATEVSISPDIGPVDFSGSTVISTATTKTFTLTATNDWGWAKHSVTVGY
jgi:hypothetical protein